MTRAKKNNSVVYWPSKQNKKACTVEISTCAVNENAGPRCESVFTELGDLFKIPQHAGVGLHVERMAVGGTFLPHRRIRLGVASPV